MTSAIVFSSAFSRPEEPPTSAAPDPSFVRVQEAVEARLGKTLDPAQRLFAIDSGQAPRRRPRLAGQPCDAAAASPDRAAAGADPRRPTRSSAPGAGADAALGGDGRRRREGQEAAGRRARQAMGRRPAINHRRCRSSAVISRTERRPPTRRWKRARRRPAPGNRRPASAPCRSRRGTFPTRSRTAPRSASANPGPRSRSRRPSSIRRRESNREPP